MAQAGSRDAGKGKEEIFSAAYVSVGGDDRANASVFASIDKDGNGLLSHSKLHYSISNFGLSEERIERLIAQMDTDTDSKPEFIAGLRSFARVVDRASDLNAGIRVPTTEYEVSRRRISNSPLVPSSGSPLVPS